jgi:hypothetical protein
MEHSIILNTNSSASVHGFNVTFLSFLLMNKEKKNIVECSKLMNNTLNAIQTRWMHPTSTHFIHYNRNNKNYIPLPPLEERPKVFGL